MTPVEAERDAAFPAKWLVAAGAVLVVALLALLRAEAWFGSFKGTSWSTFLGALLAALVCMALSVLCEALFEVLWGGGKWLGRLVAVGVAVAFFVAWYKWLPS